VGKVAAVLRIMPDSVDVDLAGLKTAMKKALPGIQEFREEPIGFGLKALKIAVVVEDEEGGTDAIEAKILQIEGVSSAETIAVNRMI
jgi:elongation factor 1-beta